MAAPPAPTIQLRVLYASQTGVAKDAAESLARDAAQRGFAVACDSLAGWDCARVARTRADDAAAAAADTGASREALPASSAAWLFVASTTGDGAMPANGQRFWRSLLRRELHAGALAGLRFAVLGLGDSSYAKFNAAARKLSTRLAQLGGSPWHERGLADEQSPLGLAGDVDIWARGFWRALESAFPRDAATAPALPAAGPQLVRAQYNVRPWGGRRRAPGGPGPDASILPTAPHCHPRGAFSLWPCAPPAAEDGGDRAVPSDGATADSRVHPRPAIVTRVQRLTAPGWTQDVRHIEFDITGWPLEWGGAADGDCSDDSPPPHYHAGDVAWVFAKNTHGGLMSVAGGDPAPATVGDGWLPALAARLGVALDDSLSVGVRRTECADCEPQPLATAPADDDAVAAPAVWPYDARVHDARATLRPYSPPVHFTSGSWLAGRASADVNTAHPSAHTGGGGGGGSSCGCPREPTPHAVVTVRELLECVLDVHGTPRRSFFTQLSYFAADAEQADKLAEMGAPSGADLFHAYCDRERRSYAEVLAEFDSVALPLAYALELLPPLQPRAYSIASSARHTPGRLALCVAVAAYTTPWGRRKAGVASSWLAALQPGDVVPLAVSRGSFALPTDPAVPLLLVGPGTGVAPMRSLVLERAARLVEHTRLGGHKAHDPGAAGVNDGPGGSPDALATRGGACLYFGCRRHDSDWLYGREFVALLRGGAPVPEALWAPSTPTSPRADAAASPSGGEATAAAPAPPSNAASFVSAASAVPAAPLAAFHTAFSRDVPGRVLYVQGLLLRHKERVFAQLTGSPPAMVFIAGSAKRMPADVVGALRDILCDVGGASVPEADAFLGGMERAGRLVIEAWS